MKLHIRIRTFKKRRHLMSNSLRIQYRYAFYKVKTRSDWNMQIHSQTHTSKMGELYCFFAFKLYVFGFPLVNAACLNSQKFNFFFLFTFRTNVRIIYLQTSIPASRSFRCSNYQHTNTFERRFLCPQQFHTPPTIIWQLPTFRSLPPLTQKAILRLFMSASTGNPTRLLPSGFEAPLPIPQNSIAKLQMGSS